MPVLKLPNSLKYVDPNFVRRATSEFIYSIKYLPDLRLDNENYLLPQTRMRMDGYLLIFYALILRNDFGDTLLYSNIANTSE